MTRLLVNPAAGGGRGAAWLDRLRGLPDLEVVSTASAADLAAQTRRAVEARDDRVLVAGGDGALHQAIQVLAGTSCALGIVPLGRGNDLARALGVPLNPQRAAARALTSTPRRIDLGRTGDRVFACVAAAGLDGEVLRHASRARARGPLTYPLALLRALFSFTAPRIAIDWDGGRFDGPATIAALANAPCFGGGMRIAPGALLDDGWLDLVVVEVLSRPRLLALLPELYRGRGRTHPAVHRHRVRGMRMVSEPPLAIHGDGEPIAASGTTPQALAIWPAALAVVG